jgi:Na+/H+ antiporter NhaD/arsenite permease-like protein
MGMGAFLALDGFFADAEAALVAFARTPARLLGCVVWAAGVLAAFITNDAVCVLGAPLVVQLVRRHHLPPLPFLLALATAANTGSVATLVGNPQNMLCAAFGGLTYREHLLIVGPIAVAALAMNHGLLRWLFRRQLRGEPLVVERHSAPISRRSGVTLAVIAATAVAYTLGADLAWAATAGFVVLMLVRRTDTRELWVRIDWSILLFFSGLFVVVEGFVRSGAPAWIFTHVPLETAAGGVWDWLRLSAIFLVGSNVVSNVPFVLVVREQMATLADPRLAWELLTVASTFAGNLTLLGSVANIIVAESARDVGGIGFVEYLRVGLPLALGTTLAGALWLFLFLPA